MRNKAFTLIELLAVIIILGILMLIAIPSVTSYINNSRKNTYVSTIQEVIKATVAKVNSGELEMYDTDTTYYIPVSALDLENGKAHSPYGELDDAYVVVTYDGEGYDYYFVGKDEEDVGIAKITKNDEVDKDKITTGIGTINTGVGIDGRSKIVIFNDDLQPGTPENATSQAASGPGTATLGTAIYFDPVTETPCTEDNAGEGTCYRWYLISRSGSVLTIHLDHYVGNSKWISDEDYGSSPAKTDLGPITLLKNLKNATTSWVRVPLLNYNYTMTTPDYNSLTYNYWDGYNGYESLSCVNGTCEIADGTQIVTDLRARVITADEVINMVNASIDYESETPSASQTWSDAFGGVAYIECYNPDNDPSYCMYETYDIGIADGVVYYDKNFKRIGTFFDDSSDDGAPGNRKLEWFSNIFKSGTYTDNFGLTLTSSYRDDYRDEDYCYSLNTESLSSDVLDNRYYEHYIYPMVTIDKSLLSYKIN